MSLFCCPICGGPLDRGPSAYSCPAGHSFDLAREGYVHLLPANRMHSKMPGDDKGMAAARAAFLSKDYYAPLRDALCSIALERTGPAPRVLDTGCGEGYYTSGVYRALVRAGRSVTMAGTDISKAILRRAAKREKDVEFAVASSYHLPVADGAVDLLVNCFSPLAIEEFRRVLSPGGAFVYVVPSEKHLWELKQVLYDRPYPNQVKQTPYPGFSYREIRHVESVIHLPCQEDIHALFQMTPYYWKTPREGAERLAALDGQVFLDETEDTYCVWRTEYRRGLCTYYMDLFTLAEDGSWDRSFELHRQRGYSVEQLTRWLEEAGFADVRTWGDGKLRRPVPGEDRVYFTCIRK